MKKIKLLTSLIGLTGLSMGLIPTIASCSSSTGLQVELVSKKKDREFGKHTNSCSYTFKLNDTSIVKNIKVKLINLKVSSSEAATVSGLIKSNYDSAGNIKVTLNLNTFKSQWPDATEFSFDLQFTNKTNNDVVVISDFSLKGEEVISAPSFEGLEWSIIAEKINEYYAGTLTLDEFVKSFGNEDEEAFTNIEDFVGCERTFKINGQDHTFRIIGVNHDTLTTPIAAPNGDTTKALFTFECKNVLCDDQGRGLRINYNSTGEFNFLEGELYKGLNEASADITWKTYDNATFTSKSVYNQLNQQVGSNVIKQVNKKVYVDLSGTATEKTYSTYCFPLTVTEIDRAWTGDNPPYTEGDPYLYWSQHKQTIDGVWECSIRPNICGEDESDRIFEAWLATSVYQDYWYAVTCLDLWAGLQQDSDPTISNAIVFAFCI